MNSKKKLATFGLTAFLFLMQYLTFAQSASYSGGNIIVNLPTLRSNQDPPQQFYTLFIETGDGNYKKTGRIDNLNNIPPQSISYPNRINTKYNAVVNVVGHYDTFPPPLRQILVHPLSNSFPVNTDVQNKLSGKKIGFDFSDTTLVPGDTTTMVVIYKTDPIKKQSDTGNHYVIAFFYNNLDVNTTGKIFSEINDVNLKYSFESNIPNTNAIRLANAERAFVNILDVPIPPTVSADPRIAKSSYKNALYFLLQYPAPIEEKNIFISISPDKLNDLNYDGTSTTFKAVKIKYNNAGSILSSEDTILSLPVRLLARDPNGISISPSCIGSADTKKLRNRISFQNDGRGKAVNVKVIMHIPTGMEFPPANFGAALHTSNQLTFFRPTPGNPSNGSPDNFYSFDILHRDIIFTMNNINLDAVRPRITNEIQRRGEIIFDLKPILSPLDNCVNIDVSIIFINKTVNGFFENSPVKASASIKKNCKPGQGRCPRLPIEAQ